MFGKTPETHIDWCIGSDRIPCDEEATHIGVARDCQTGGAKATVHNNISKANKAFFAKFTNLKNSTPQAAIAIYQSSILPILTYGTEVIIHNQKFIALLQDSQDYFIKQILGLPSTGVATYAPELLSGLLPIEAVTHKRTLGLLVNILNQPDSLEAQIITRQAACSGMLNKHCWVAQTRRILALYDLPSLFALIQSPPSKHQWKVTVINAVNIYWESVILDSTSLFPSLRMCNTLQFSVGEPHLALTSVSTSPMDVRRAKVKIKLLTGSYPLQANRPNFNQFSISACALCKKEPEDRMHFLLKCEMLDSIRKDAWKPLSEKVMNVLSVNMDSLPLKSALQLIIDPKCFVLQNPNVKHHIGLESLESTTRWYCNRLHIGRRQLLPLVPRRKRAKKKVHKPGRYEAIASTSTEGGFNLN